MYEDLSQKQIEILYFIKNEIQKKGYPPSVREICKGVNLKSTSSVHNHLEKLEKKSYIRKDATKPRTIEILNRDEEHLFAPKKTVDIPILKKVTIEQEILDIKNIKETFPIPLDIAKKGQLFMLEVQENSMIKDGIFYGDYLLVKQQNSAEDGDIVLALLDDEITVRKFYKEPVQEVEILGKVIGLYRNIK